MNNHSSLAVALTIALTLGLAAEARAEGNIAVFGGAYLPDGDFAEEDFIGGVRGGYRFPGNWGIEGEISLVEAETVLDEFLGPEGYVDFFFFDLSFQWFPGGGDFALFGGPGAASIDILYDAPGGRYFETTADLFSLHAGLSYQAKIGNTFFIRPDLRIRWIDDEIYNDDIYLAYDNFDTEITLGFGWRFGG